MDHKVTTDYTRLLHNSNVKVYVRARPCADGKEAPDDMFERKQEAPKNIVIKDTERMQYGNHAFSFDNIYWTDTDQQTLFESTSKTLVDYALKGINNCCFAYGQTGSGKTFSIFGESGEKAGLLPRTIEYLFDMIERNDNKSKEFTLVVSFLEIYCDRVRDLARDYLKKSGRPVSYQTSSSTDWFLKQQQMHRSESSSSINSIPPVKIEDEYDYEKANFEIHEDAQGRVFVKDLSMATVKSRHEVDLLVQSGLKLRATHETKMNAVSSRSHTVFTIHVFQQIHDTAEIMYGQLNMVDLAGSERLKKSESDGQRLKEALHINSSLSAVGKVVMSLDPESGYNYIPYRDSKLTRLLQNSIGGNSYTILLATIHPMKEHYEECLSTLQFANRCRSVQNQPRVNHINGSASDKDRRIRKLQEELAILRRQVEGLRAEYNNRFIRALQELGFEAEEMTENGEIKFADGTVLKSAFSDNPEDVSSSEMPGSPLRHVGGGGVHGGVGPYTGQGIRKANELSKKDRDHLRQKYANAKTNFSVVVSEANKEKEESRKSVNELKRRIATLEETMAQKEREYKRALNAESERHRSEIQQMLNNTATFQQQQLRSAPFTTGTPPNGKRIGSAGSTKPPIATFSTAQMDQQRDQQLLQRVEAVEQSKNGEIALIRQQYDQIIRTKKEEMHQMQERVERMRIATTQTVENLRGDCDELYAYIGRMQHVLEAAQRGHILTTPKNLLADHNKLRHMKALLATDSKRHLQFQLQCVDAGMTSSSLNHSASMATPQSKDQSSARISRPVSAPVRRAIPSNYPSMLRDKVKETAPPPR